MDRIVAFDVETPNYNNDRICSIGITLIEDGVIIDNVNYLVDPECRFDPFNISIHGIREEDVKGKPTFIELWDTIGRYFSDNILVAHNARFDLGVLGKTLRHYNINIEEVNYVDTLKIARRIVKSTINHKLPTLCWYYDIELNHHDSGSDSNACAQLLMNLLDDGAEIKDYVCKYKLENRW